MSFKSPENSYHDNEKKPKKKKKEGRYFAENLGASDLKLGMHMKLHSQSNMVWIPPGHTSSPCIRPKRPKMVFQPKHLNLGS